LTADAAASEISEGLCVGDFATGIVTPGDCKHNGPDWLLQRAAAGSCDTGYCDSRIGVATLQCALCHGPGNCNRHSAKRRD